MNVLKTKFSKKKLINALNRKDIIFFQIKEGMCSRGCK